MTFLFNMESPKGQSLVRCCLIYTCSRAPNTIFPTPMTHSSTLQFLPVKGDRTVVVEALKQQIESSVIPLFVKPCERAKKVGVILDADLKFQKQISNISKTACYHLKKNDPK